MAYGKSEFDGFRTPTGRDIFKSKYSRERNWSWRELTRRCAENVVLDNGTQILSQEFVDIAQAMEDFKFIPGGRYLYYTGRQTRFYNNCALMRSLEDTREDWARTFNTATQWLMSGAGIGNDYSVYRPSGITLARTGGVSSGPIPAMLAVNEIGRQVRQGGSRRSAIYGSLTWNHGDAPLLLKVKDWAAQEVVPGLTVAQVKERNWDFPAPLDHTNISLNYNDDWLDIPERHLDPTFLANVEMAMRNGEPGFSFNFGLRRNETLRNACTEVVSSDNNDVCNLGSLNMAAFDDIEDFRRVVRAATAFLLCGTLVSELPVAEAYAVREKNRRLGLGLMGIHEWLLRRGYRYEAVPELHQWLSVWREESDTAAREYANYLDVATPAGVRAIAPTGSIGMLAGTTTGIEPIYCVAYNRRWLHNGEWQQVAVVDPTAQRLIEEDGVDPDAIETAMSLAHEPERRLAFQAAVQAYVDQGISSTLNLPAWGSDANNPNRVANMAAIISKYAPRLRGMTLYPDGARGGQPIVPISYADATRTTHEAHDRDACVLGEGVCGS